MTEVVAGRNSADRRSEKMQRMQEVNRRVQSEALQGAAKGLLISAPLVLSACRFVPALRKVVTPGYKAFLIMSGTITGGVLAGERVHVSSVHDPSKILHPSEHGAYESDKQVMQRRSLYQWVMDYRFGLLGAVWATSIGVSFANQMRQPSVPMAVKLGNTRVTAQVVTLASVVAIALSTALGEKSHHDAIHAREHRFDPPVERK